MPRKEMYQKIREACIAYSTEWNRANVERRREIRKKYKQSEKGKASAKRYKQARRAAHRLARVAWRDQEAIDALYLRAARLGMHVDHIVPLRHPWVCGLHVETNLRLVDGRENQRKGNRWWPDMPHIELVDP